MPTNPIDHLLDQPVFADPWPEAEFVRAVDACHGMLCRRFPRYAEFVARRLGTTMAGSIGTMDDVAQLPPIFLPVLKELRFDLPEDVAVTVRLTSSGTSGRPSVVPLDEPNMKRRVAAMLAGYRGQGVVAGSMEAIGFLVDPTTTQMAGSVVIDAVLRSMSEIRSVRYLARWGASGPDYCLAEAMEILSEAAAKGPVLLVGYPALIAAVIGGLKEQGTERVSLSPGSFVLTGGGWKSFLPGVGLDQAEFRRLVAGFFELVPSSIRDMFGLSECPAVFVQCAEGHYHVPSFALGEAVDPETLKPQPDGEMGLLQLTVPLTTSYPLVKILTTDKATIARGCPCGIAAPYLIPAGRAAAARYETCAMTVGRAVA